MEKDISFVGKYRQHEDSLFSTHQYLTELVSKTNPPDGFCLTTDYQSGGRGQIGRNWHSEAGKNILVSYVFYPVMEVGMQFFLNIWVSLAVFSTVRTFGIQKVSIKWPNDIYIGDKKVAGILIQNTLQGHSIKNCIVSVGLNVNELTFPSEIPNPTSMASEAGHEFDRALVLSALHGNLEEGYSQIADPRDRRKTKALYEENLFGKHDWYLYRREDESFLRARVSEVTEEGLLVLENQDSSIEKFSFRQVSWVGVK